MKKTTFNVRTDIGLRAKWRAILLFVFVLGSFSSYAQTTYYSKSTATDFNSLTSWGTATDGTGTAPASISNADNFIVANNAALTLSATATVRQLTINSGSLTVSANTLNVSKAGTFDTTFSVTGGSLIVNGGTINLNGNFNMNSGANFTQTGGDFNIDGNAAGSTTNSVAASTPIFRIGNSTTAYSTGTISLTGGTITIIDPHTAASASTGYALYVYFPSGFNIECGASHTFRFGDGTSTDAGGHASGFYVDPYVSSGRFNFGKIVVNNPSGTNRNVVTPFTIGAHGDLNITAGTFAPAALIFKGNLNITGGTYVTSGALTLAAPLGTGSAVNTTAQTITATSPGVLKNAATGETANFGTLVINNSSSAGVSFAGTNNIATQPANSVSATTLTFTAGRASTTGGAVFVLGTSAPSAGTLNYTSGGFASGTTFGRWFTATGAGTTITAAADATGTGGRYPFVNATNFDRSAFIERNTAAAAAGILAVTYTAGAGSTTISATDGAATVDKRGNDTWAVSSLSGTPTAATSFDLLLLAPGAFGAPLTAANARVIQGAAFAGTHQAGTVTPGGQRVLSPAELVAGAFSIAVSSADLPYVSVASGNWNAPSTWSTGVVPACTDVVNIGAGTTVTVNSAGAVSKNVIVATGATLTVASGDLTVGCTANNNTLTVNGTLNVSGGTLNMNGNINAAASAVFNQTGGTIRIDGNAAGVVASSVASGTPLFNSASTNVSLTGGTLMIVDPHVATTNSSAYAINFTNGTASTASLSANPAHITQFGDGVSTDAGGNTSGFYVNAWASTAYLSFGSIVINGGTGTNRAVNFQYQVTANGNFTINSGNTVNATQAVIVGGNLNVAGTLINTVGVVSGVVTSNTTTALTFGPTTLAQTFTSTGTISNLAASPTANFTALTVNNTNAAGLTLAAPFSVSGTLTLTAGKVNTTTANLLTLGIPTAAGMLSGGSTTAYISGPFARVIASGNANTSYITFPVGKAAYAPVFLAPTTTAVTVMKAEAFDTNTGTMDPGIINLAANRRWEAPVVSGTVTDVKVRLGDSNITATKIPAMAPTAAGVYTSSFGSTATYTAGTPNTIQGLNAILTANYTGFLSFAESNVCSGTPAPGNTIASANNICAGTSVTFSVQNNTTGTGVTYQWQSSVNGTTFTDIASATNTTYTVTPSAALYYRLNVTCATGPVTGSSTPVQITFATAAPASTTPATRCGEGPVTLSATGSGTLHWYTSATATNVYATGTSITPQVTATTDYYVSNSSVAPGINVPVGAGASTSSDYVNPLYSAWSNNHTQHLITAQELTAAGLSAGPINSIALDVTNAGTLPMIDLSIKIGNSTATGMTAFADNSGFSPVYSNASYMPTAGVNTFTFSTPFNWNGTSNIIVEFCHGNAASTATMSRTVKSDATAYVSTVKYHVSAATAASAVCGTTTGTNLASYSVRPQFIFNGMGLCLSARQIVTATVTPAPTLTLSGNPATICSGQTTAPVTVTAGASNYDSYVWAPSAGVSGNATTGWTFNPAVTTTYSLTATNTVSGCVKIMSVNVTVNSLPGAVTISPDPMAVCQGSSAAIVAQGAVVNVNAIVGTGTTAPGTTNWPNPFTAWYGGVKTQILFKATELTAQGLLPNNNINALAFDFFASVASQCKDLTIKIGSASVANMTSGFVDSSTFTTVYNADFTPTATATGFVGFTFTTPFMWTGGDIIVEVIHNAGNTGNGTGTRTNTTTTAYDSVYYGAKDSVTPAGAPSFAALTMTDFTTGTSTRGTTALRPNIRFTQNINNTVTWAPVTNLFTDVATTIPYTGQNLATVYTKPTAAITYVATVTNAAGCSITADVDVTVTITPAPTVPAPTQEICNAGTVADLVATGTAVKWYAASTGGTALAATTALVNGTIYYASQTVGGCESVTRTARTATINVVAAPTVANTAQTFCNAGTVADLLPNGASIKWYAAATGGTALVSTTALVSGNSYYASQTVNGCESIPRTAVTATNIAPAAPTVANTAQTFCNAATVADLLPNDASIKWYAASTGGTALLSTDALVSGSHYFASQTVNGCEGIARTDVTVTITVIPAPVINDTDQEFCNAATVAELMPNDASIKWYAAATGGTALTATDALADGTSYFASQTVDGCEGLVRTEVAVTINVTPVPTGDNEQEFCTSAVIDDLVADGNGIIWYDAETGGTPYIGSEALVDGTIYYAAQVIAGCEGLTRFGVTAVIHTVVADAPADVSVCTEYTLPALTSGAYFTETGGQGIELAAGSVIGETTTLYVYAQEGTDVVCSDENSFTVTVANIEAPTGDDTQTIEGNVAADATVSDLVTDTTTGTITWYASEEDALAGENALSGDTQLVQGATYYATQTVGTCTSEDVFAVTVDIVLDRETFDVKAFTYHPNPVKDVLNLSYSSEITTVTVFNMLGQRVIAQQSNATDVKVDMSSLADGAYVVNVTSGNTVKTIKVIKKQ